jgi:hypothetical protein
MNGLRRFGFVVVWFCSVRAAAADDIRIIVDGELPPAARRALHELREALVAHGDRIDDRTAPDGKPEILVGLRQQSLFRDVDGSPPIAKVEGPECAATAWIDGRRKLLITGADERGLTYALRDAARGIEVLPKGEPWTKGITPAVEAPFLRVRNVSVHLFNADCEREWFFSEEFWHFYFRRLSLSRFNRCTLTFCDQTNYLCPPYAYLVDMPEYPNVQVGDCTPEQRAQNRAMLRRIAELADEYAIDFDLGIWMQAPVEKWAAPVMVSGLPEGLELAKYCALGLRRVLEACPSLDGIQLRMNAEAGVPEDEQTAFYKPMFQAMAAFQAAQRPQSPLRLELRYKGLKQETIDAAVAEKLDVTVSTKFWAEHFGLPYHPTVVDSHWAKDRYSFGTMLHKPRNYRVTYQLWTVGSQRLTLWGDPDYAARFARSCTLGDGEGFEVFAPLTNKGYGNRPGAWPVIKNPEYRVGKWEQERYWAFYLAFGRMGYNPQSKLDFWNREFKHRFGDAAEHVEKAYRAASQVLPLITAQLLPSASEWYWWPEMDTGGDLETYARIQPSDPGMFTGIRRWEKTPGWRWEEWDETPGYFEEVVAQNFSGRDFANLLSAASDLQSYREDSEKRPHPDSTEWRITIADCKLLVGLARFHMAKLNAALTSATYEASNERYFLEQSASYLRQAQAAWQSVIAATDGIYHDDLVFGITPDMPRSKNGHHHSGHWRDRLKEIEADIKDFGERVGTEHHAKVDHDRLIRWCRPSYLSSEMGYEHSHKPRPLVIGQPATIEFASGSISLSGKFAPENVSVFVRPLDQTAKWQELSTTRDAGGRVWTATVPVSLLDGRYDLQYYFKLTHEKSPPQFWPWQGVAEYEHYFVVPVEAAK